MKDISKKINSSFKCSLCDGGMDYEKNNIKCISCGAVYTIKGNKIFCFEYLGGIPKIREQARNKRKWSLFRKANFLFYEKNLASVKDNSLVLDLGVGEGQFRDIMERFDVIGVDFIPYEDVDVVCDLNKKIPFKDNIFDVVIASNVLEHIPDTEALLKECFRIIKPGGKILVTVPFLLRVHQEPYDFHRYTPFMLDLLFKDAIFNSIVIVSLSTPYEVYSTMRLHFFMKVFNYHGKSFFHKLPVKILWNIQKFLSIFESSLSKKILADEGYTTGYGVVAKKNK